MMNINTMSEIEVDPFDALNAVPEDVKKKAWESVDKHEAQQEWVEKWTAWQLLLWSTKDNKDFWSEFSTLISWPAYDDVMNYIKKTKTWGINDEIIKAGIKDPMLVITAKNGKQFTLTEIYKDLVDITSPKIAQGIEKSQWFGWTTKGIDPNNIQGLHSLDFIRKQSEKRWPERIGAIKNFLQKPLGNSMLESDDKFKQRLKEELSIEGQNPTISLLFTLSKEPWQNIEDFKDDIRKSLTNDSIGHYVKLYNVPVNNIWLLKNQYPWAEIYSGTDSSTIIRYSLSGLRSYLQQEKQQYYKDSFSQNILGWWQGSMSTSSIDMVFDKSDFITKENLYKVFNPDQSINVLSSEKGLLPLLQENKNSFSERSNAIAKNSSNKPLKLGSVINKIELRKTPSWERQQKNNNKWNPFEPNNIIDTHYAQWSLYLLNPKITQDKEGNAYSTLEIHDVINYTKEQRYDIWFRKSYNKPIE